MIEIFPKIAFEGTCPFCHAALRPPARVLWQGIHICAECVCPGCRHTIVSDLPVAHGELYPFIVDLTQGRLHGGSAARSWFGEPLLASLRKPSEAEVDFRVEQFFPAERVVVLNCVDYLYGHALLKLLNAERHLSRSGEFGTVVIVPEFLRWMVPDGVSEIWTVGLPLSRARQFHPRLDERINQELRRYGTVFVSRAQTHPALRDITPFTRQAPHRFDPGTFRITFVWREDRLWAGPAAGKLPGLILSQRLKVSRLLAALTKRFPESTPTVAGLGTTVELPGWIDDQRAKQFTPELERSLCRVYAESRVVIGVHGSSMLLPSAHAGMTVDLMPPDRWGNFAQDVLFLEHSPRLAAFRYRMLPLGISPAELAEIVAVQIADWPQFRTVMG